MTEPAESGDASLKAEPAESGESGVKAEPAESRDAGANAAHPAWAALTQAAGLLGAAAALVYLGGAIVFWLRLRALDLPADAIFSYMPREFLISVGVREVLLPLIALTALYLLLFAVTDSLEGKKKQEQEQKRATVRRQRRLSYVLAFLLIGVGVIAFITDSRPVGFLSFYFGVLFLISTRSSPWLRARLSKRSEAVKGMVMSAYVATLMLPAAIAFANWQWQPQQALICTKTGLTMTGDLIGVTADNIYISQPTEEQRQDSTPVTPRVVAVRGSETAHFYFGETSNFWNGEYRCEDPTPQSGTLDEGSD
jgi:hypothetical protein